MSSSRSQGLKLSLKGWQSVALVHRAYAWKSGIRIYLLRVWLAMDFSPYDATEGCFKGRLQHLPNVFPC